MKLSCVGSYQRVNERNEYETFVVDVFGGTRSIIPWKIVPLCERKKQQMSVRASYIPTDNLPGVILLCATVFGNFELLTCMYISIYLYIYTNMREARVIKFYLNMIVCTRTYLFVF